MSARHDADSALKTLSFGVYPHEAGREALLESLLLNGENLNTPTFCLARSRVCYVRHSACAAAEGKRARA